MATRSAIGYLKGDAVRAIYCHWDGHPGHNGRILAEHYTDFNKIQELIELGDLSVLGENIGEKCDFNNHPEHQCVSYIRDRGEQSCFARDYGSIKEFQVEFRLNGIEYWYLWDGNAWLVKGVDLPTGGWQKVEEVLKELACENS